MTTVTTTILNQIALRNLSSVSEQLTTVQSRISSGRRVDRAADNPAAYAQAESLRARIKTNEAVATALSGAKGAVTIASTAVTAVGATLKSARETLLKLADESLSPSSRAQYVLQLKGQIDQIGTQIDGARFNGINLIGTEDRNAPATPTDPLDDTAPRPLTVSRGPDGGVLTITPTNLKGLSNAVSGGNVTGFLALSRLVYNTVDDTSLASDPQYLSVRATISAAQAQAALGKYDPLGPVETVFRDALTAFDAEIASSTSALGIASKTIDAQLELNSNHAAYLETTVGELVDADVAADSSLYKALEVRQQLATQALSIANQNAGAILALFR